MYIEQDAQVTLIRRSYIRWQPSARKWPAEVLVRIRKTNVFRLGRSAESAATVLLSVTCNPWRSKPCSAPTDVADPFDTVEWDIRTAAIKGEDGEVLFEQTNCEVPAIVEPVGHQRRGAASISTARSDTPQREHSVRQLIHRVSRTIADWGMEDGYFATRRRRRAILPRADLALPAPARRVQFAGLVQRRPVPPVRRQGLAVQLALGRRERSKSSSPRTPTSIRKARPASSRASTTTWKTSWSWRAARPCCSSSARAPAPTCRRCVRTARSSPAAASPRARCRSCGSTTRSRRWSRAAARPAAPPRCSRSRSGTPTSWNSSSARPRKRRRPAC